MMISVVIPAFNEAERIGETLRAIQAGNFADEIIVVDDGSSDTTTLIAEKFGAKVIINRTNLGKGQSLNAGIQAANGDIILLLDADLGDTAVQAKLLLPPLLQDESDMSIATFPVIPGKGGGMGFVVRLARDGIERKTGQVMQAPLSGQRAIRRTLLETVGPIADGFSAETALTIDALCAGFRVTEVPTNMTHRVTGRSFNSYVHRLKQYVAVRKALSTRSNKSC